MPHRFGKAKIEREGGRNYRHVQQQVGFSLEAAEVLAQEGLDVEVINLLSLRPLDRDAIIDSVKKTNRLITVEEGCHTVASVLRLVQ